jgi:hypothetical protein
MIEHRIRIVAAEKLGAHPPLVFGRFVDNQLTFVLASDGKNCRTWSIEPHEDCVLFEQRIVRDLAEIANVAHPALAAE